MSDHSAILPDHATHGPFDLERLVVGGGSLLIEVARLGTRELKVELSFEFHLAMRRTGESDAFNVLREVDAAAGLGNSFYESRSSEFMRWFGSESAGVHAGSDVRNYTILCVDDVIDVVALVPPTVRVLDGRQG